jgi:hypothetical protein
MCPITGYETNPMVRDEPPKTIKETKRPTNWRCPDCGLSYCGGECALC